MKSKIEEVKGGWKVSVEVPSDASIDMLGVLQDANAALCEDIAEQGAARNADSIITDLTAKKKKFVELPSRVEPFPA